MFPLQERFNESRIVWSILGSYRDTPCVSSWIPVLGGKIHIFLSGSPNVVWPSNCLKIHPIAVFFLLTGLALLPLWDFWGKGAAPNSPLGAHLRCRVPSTRWPQYGTGPSQTHTQSLLLHGQDHSELWMCLQGSESAGRHTALTP